MIILFLISYPILISIITHVYPPFSNHGKSFKILQNSYVSLWSHHFKDAAFRGIYGFRDQMFVNRAPPNKTFRNRNVFPPNWMFLSQRFPERSKATMEWKNGLVNSERERRRERKREGKKMSIYLALTKKEKIPPPKQLSIQTTR